MLLPLLLQLVLCRQDALNLKVSRPRYVDQLVRAQPCTPHIPPQLKHAHRILPLLLTFLLLCALSPCTCRPLLVLVLLVCWKGLPLCMLHQQGGSLTAPVGYLRGGALC
jgi:hypothetical protein